jgi:biotin carboxyl carrier protein
MKFKVNVDNRTFEVEVGDLYARPITVLVDGEAFEVWPEESMLAALSPAAAPAPTAAAAPRPGTGALRPVSAKTPAVPGRDRTRIVAAPIPGVIVSIAVQPGDSVTAGQELCVLEAMKMKNVIRAARAGEIAVVHVAVGQHVKHQDPLIEYAD